MNSISLKAGVISSVLTHPLDFLKLKTFLINEGIGITGKGLNMGYNSATIFDNFLNRGYGTRVLYTGLSSALLSRVSFLLGRNNTYKYLYDKYKPHKVSNDLLYLEKGLISGLSSLVGSFLSSPFMVSYVRQVGDIGRNVKYHRTDTSFQYRGFFPYALRMFLLNSFLIWPYNSANEKLYVTFGEVYTNRIIATLYAAALGTILTVPFDNIRTRIQYQSTDRSINRMTYRGFFDCITKIYRNEGVFSFYAGAQISYFHLVAYTLSTVYLCDLFVDQAKMR
jgi:solute carrier family 25 oxoglutarate transporter 11